MHKSQVYALEMEFDHKTLGPAESHFLVIILIIYFFIDSLIKDYCPTTTKHTILPNSFSPYSRPCSLSFMWNQLHTRQLQNLQNSSTRTRVKCGFQVHM
ncbi:hypothetical protein HanPI659440_Chr15g0603011 [Helianthus annuus]|nr:hypothetical protein HanPI659440_Chr15g0603011 [Helianthus annuus]